MARYRHTEGICLRRIEYSNTSQVACFLTPDVGRLSVMAKGVTRAPKKGVRTGLDLLSRYELIYTARRPPSLQNLTYRWMREGYRGMRRALQPVLCGYYAAELMLNLTAEGDPCPTLYELLLRTLQSFAEGKALGVSVLMLEMGALQEHGSLPLFDECPGCGRRVPQTGTVQFSPSAGGAVCSACRDEAHGMPGGPTMRVRAPVMQALSQLGRPARGAPSSGAPPALTPQRTIAMSSLLRFHIRYLLGKELRMWKYLQRRELTRSLTRIRRRAGIGT